MLVIYGSFKRRVVRAILQEINGEKRPEKARDFFGVSNLSFFQVNITDRIITESKSMFPIAHASNRACIARAEHCPHGTSSAIKKAADRLSQLVEFRTTVREVVGSNFGRTITQGLQITEEKELPL